MAVSFRCAPVIFVGQRRLREPSHHRRDICRRSNVPVACHASMDGPHATAEHIRWHWPGTRTLLREIPRREARSGHPVQALSVLDADAGTRYHLVASASAETGVCMQRDAARSPGLIVAVCALAFSTAHGAQEQPAGTFRTDANYIRVDLYPTQNGVPVTDLRTDEVEILDEGVPQKIDRFEHVLVRGAGLPQVEAGVPPTAAGPPRSTAVAGTPSATPVARSRFFVLFLDTLHVDAGPSLTISRPLARALDALIGG